MKTQVGLVIITSIFILAGCMSISAEKAGTNPPSHRPFDALIKQYVDAQGGVDYAGFQRDSSRLIQYLDLLGKNPPNKENWTTSDELAYWINVYNAFTIKLIIDYYPLESIKDIGSKIQVPFVNTPWDIKFIDINGEMLSLNNVEHNILRKNYEEPRIHFAIVCASYSCPSLRAEAFTGEKLDAQLTEQAQLFLDDPTKNVIATDKIKISRLFSWFKGDFTKDGSLIDFINRYAAVKIDRKAKASYMDYDWSLNTQKK